MEEGISIKESHHTMGSPYHVIGMSASRCIAHIRFGSKEPTESVTSHHLATSVCDSITELC